MYGDEDFLALSGIQHYAFCRRQWALIHIEQVWSDNVLTVEGTLMHERAHDEGLRERRGDTITVRGLTVRSARLGVWGKCDVVEFHADGQGQSLHGEDGLWVPRPVEYKHGRTKRSDVDRLQLCAQAMCLEEMLSCGIPYGCLYYGATHSRERVDFDMSLRASVERAFSEMHRIYKSHSVPKAKRTSACRSCSLVELCIPKESSVSSYVNNWLKDCP